MTNVTVYKGTSKAGKEYKALKIEIGEWTQLYFPRTKFEMDYIEKVLLRESKGSLGDNFLDD